MPRRLLACIGLACLFFGCRAAPEDITGPETPWDEMSHGDREAYMVSTVLPYMRKRFQEFDAERYADFDCATCHGSGAEDGTYEMPSPDIPALSKKHFRKEHTKKHPEMVRFMWEHIEIEMATLLGRKTGLSNFNCRGCHTTR